METAPLENSKRLRSDSITSVDNEDDLTANTPSRRRITLTKDLRIENKLDSKRSEGRERWRSHRMMEDFVDVVGDLMYPQTHYGTFGYSSNRGMYPISRLTMLGYLENNPLRRIPIFGMTSSLLTSFLIKFPKKESWNPSEIARFESSISLFGKNFRMIQKHVASKTVKEIIAFYYEWKKTGHYRQWKLNYKPDGPE